MSIHLSLRTQLLALNLLLLAGAAFLVVRGYQSVYLGAVVDNVQRQSQDTGRMLNLVAAPALIAGDDEMLGTVLDELLAGDGDIGGLNYVLIGREDGTPLLQAGAAPQPLPAPDTEVGEAVWRGLVHLRQPILLAGNEVGFLQFGFSTRDLLAATRRASRQALVGTLLALVLVGGAVFAIGLRISRRIEALTAASEAIVTGDYAVRARTEGHDELARLGRHYNQMAEAIALRVAELEASRSELSDSNQAIRRLNESLESRVAERTQELAEKNRELETSLHALNAARDQLIQAEKLAGLGALVAGVAHELNSPIGNARVVGSSFADELKLFERSMDQGLRRSALDNFLAMARTAAELLERNLSRAAELIQSFKQVAVDQSSSQRRRFDLKLVVEEILMALAPAFKRRPIRLAVAIPEGITLDSYPGPLGQILTNLVNNALIHAYAEDQAGTLRIEAAATETGLVMLSVADDGAGIAPEDLRRIFDPFFTTRLGQGGSGLGMHIVYTLVTGVLGGSIQVASAPGQGTRFRLDLPLVAPEFPAASTSDEGQTE